MAQPDTGAATGRRRGRPPRIDRARIVAAARELDPETLTMQAVAERLGVDRKALNYHVNDRERLLELVASDALATRLGSLQLPHDGDWQDAVRVYTRAMRDAMIGIGALFDYVRMPLSGGEAALASVEGLLQVLVRAGFTADEAGRTVALLAELLVSSARDAVLIERHGVHPQLVEVRRVLDAAPADAMPGLRGLRDLGLQAGDAQLEFDLEVVLAGLEQRLARDR
ncbi:TetR/AcrR family transcriptional regulator C-terminal domain-containing protein [Cryptosporangium aurantiacum]|uniref:Transcriptional regulator, TetR family n=1 Tax=Cryptosporangium aurantiacum TaxID=134849 RepID=A0A1M7RNC0_9ACTN|nr:TetR/AcrR family transcriptional regulator C-terminal domain-containing protein [Cryptosporangium aurantiacum]SHN47701.1 transcriptional regulator, TetR family [Cryptosporangium aurantiacum]